MSAPRVIIIGLDSVSPRIAFDVFADEMPCLKGLRAQGMSGPLRSTDPPVTVPAWVSMTTGLDPGALGIYGFRNRVSGSYGMRLVADADVPSPRLWEIAGQSGLTSVVVSVPLTYPPRLIPGTTLLSCFLTPDDQASWITPHQRRADIEGRFGPYLVDVPDFRTDAKAHLVQACRRLSDQHFGIFRYLLDTERPHFAMLVDLAPDRLHHGLLGAILPDHPGYAAADPALVDACAAFYRNLDRQIARTLAFADSNTTVIVVSDHGVRPLEGGLCVNEWLIQEGYLVIEDRPSVPTPLSQLCVDWTRTRAWGEGGHHGRICFNVAGREPDGIISADRLPEEKAGLMSAITGLKGPSGRVMKHQVIPPERHFPICRGLPPDLIVYWDELRLRSIGTVGHGSVWIGENDLGPDEANHDPQGIFIISGGDHLPTLPQSVADIFEIALGTLGLKPPETKC
ncbi:MAG: alkaline phosphatase family protein [Myxococcota bacterium]|nr:alkaline phosphatase family protein [Myxococcota bacterium]